MSAVICDRSTAAEWTGRFKAGSVHHSAVMCDLETVALTKTGGRAKSKTFTGSEQEGLDSLKRQRWR